MLPNGVVSESISGVVLHALHLWTPNALAEIDKVWLQKLPKQPILVSDADRPYYYFKTKDGVANDDFVQIKLPWLIVATVDAYPSGSLLERAKALRWLENAIDHPSVHDAETKPENWWRAELLYSLDYLVSHSK